MIRKPKLSIVIKALNEEAKIASAIESALAAISHTDGEVILADSLSSDRTVEIASRYPITIVQMLSAGDRGCGAAAQLGFQASRGEFVYLLDGDMTLSKAFIEAAIEALESDSALAGVGGTVTHRNLQTREFRMRAARKLAHLSPGMVDRLDGGGLFRRKAIDDVGYLADRNLHSFEELELGARLAAKGWTLKRLDLAAVEHDDHTLSDSKLMLLRWRMGYVAGPGELLRAVWGKPHFLDAVVKVRVIAIVILTYLWLAVILTLVFAGGSGGLIPAIILLMLPFIAMSARRRSVALGLQAVVHWLVYAAAFPRGLLARRKNPLTPIASRTIKTAQGYSVDRPAMDRMDPSI